MRKNLKDLDGCLCEQTEDTEVCLDYGDYTILGAKKDEFGLSFVAWGEGMAEYRVKYCPFCGRRL